MEARSGRSRKRRSDRWVRRAAATFSEWALLVVRAMSVDRFLSHFTNRLDAKGRISIPASYRSVLARDGFEGLYVHPSLDQMALDCGGNALLGEIDGLLTGLPLYSEQRDMFSTALLGTSEILKLDSEGRVMLPEPLKVFAGIEAEASFVGLGRKFQIWEPNRFRAHLDEARAKVRDLRRQFVPGVGDAPTPLRGARE